jgi:hypothetical protein
VLVANLVTEYRIEGGSTIARIAGCEVVQARELMEKLPVTLTTPLYKPQAQRLIRELNRKRVLATLLSK